jgi:hypothetical protein
MVEQGQAAANTSAAPAASTPALAQASPAASQSSPQAQPATAVAAPAATEAVRPDYVSEEFWDAEAKTVKVDTLAAKFKELNDARTAEEARRATLPKAANEYKVELPQDFKLPDGWQIDAKDPSWGAFAEFAHAKGLSQEDFANGAKLITQMRLNEAAARVEGAKAEFAKLGDQGSSIVQGVHNFIDANAGSPEAAAAVKASLVNSEAVKFFTQMAKTMTSNGIASFNGSGRDDGRRADGKPQNWDSMSAVDRRSYDLSNPQRAASR